MRLVGYTGRDLVRNPRRTLASLVGVVVGVGLFASVLFFIDASGASMTRRAVAPLALDMQRVLTSPPGGGLKLERTTLDLPPAPDGSARLVLTVTNPGPATAHEVVVRERFAAPRSYVAESTIVDRVPVPDVGGAPPVYQGAAGTGLNLGAVEPGASRRVSYRVLVAPGVPAGAEEATVSSREAPAPVRAGAPAPMQLPELAAAVRALPGVEAASPLVFVGLPGEMSAGETSVEGPIKLFSFDAAYAANYPSIKLVSGSIRPGAIAISAEAARDLKVTEGGTVSVDLPGDAEPLTLPVSGITDLSGARPLFESREWRQFEKFVYAPYTVVVDPEVYTRQVAPAFAAAAAQLNTEIASYPFEELDIRVDRSRLDADPATALVQAEQVAAAVRAIAPEQDSLIDNLSNTLAVAKGDARIAKRMFVFLGLPGAVLAAILTAYAGTLLAAAQRRESALLRLRGARRGQLTYLLTLRTLALAGAGAVLGTALGLGAVLAVLGRDVLFEASTGALVQSALIAAGGGALVTALALYLPGRRAARQEISSGLSSGTNRAGPPWWRMGLESAALAAAVGAQQLALHNGAFDGPPGSVYSGRSVSLPLHLLVAPIVGWVAGTLLIAHLLTAVTAGARTARGARRFSAPVRGVLWRSITRRTRALSTGVIAVALVVGLGTMLACFATAYDRAEAEDARFAVGSDVRLTPNPASGFIPPISLAAQWRGEAVAGVTPVVYGLENTALTAATVDDVTSMAAIDPNVYPLVASLPDDLFVDSSAAAAMSALAAHPDGILLNAAAAKSFGLRVGDSVKLLLDPEAEEPVQHPVQVLGLFTRFPGAPSATDLVANLSYYEQQTGRHDAGYFLLAARDRSPAGVTAVLSSVQSTPDFAARFDVSTAAANLDKDKSSLTALNVRGLLHLGSFFTFLMAATATALFVFGLLMQRRREYVTLRAQGLHGREVRRLVLAESGLSAVLGAGIGIVVGIVASTEFVRVLRPIFLLPPRLAPPAGALGTLVGLLLGATVLAGAAAAVMLNRLEPAELLREQ